MLYFHPLCYQFFCQYLQLCQAHQQMHDLHVSPYAEGD